MKLDRFNRPAVVVVDMQNDFVRVGAPLEVPEARPTIPVHQALLASARQRGIPIIYTKFLAGPEWTLMWEWSSQLEPPIWACQRQRLLRKEIVKNRRSTRQPCISTYCRIRI